LREPPGERFRKAIKEIEAACAKRKLVSHELCGGVAKLKPADPLATEEGRFAHSITIPNPVPADSGYKPGMTPQEYFEHLCETEAGAFIDKTVENVEGLYMMRPWERVFDDHLQHLYALADPDGHEEWETKNAALAPRRESSSGAGTGARRLDRVEPPELVACGSRGSDAGPG
jgi:hypothetical protein